jgi:hypothetical protein
MKIKQYIPAPFALSILLSLVLHLLLIAGVTGMGGFSLPESFSQPIFITSIEEEKPLVPLRVSPPRAPVRAKVVPPEPSVPPSPPPPPKPEVQEKRAETEVPAAEVTTPPEAKSSPSPDAAPETEQKPPGEPLASPQKAKTEENYVQLLKHGREKLYYEIYWLDIYVGNAIMEAVSEDDTVTITSQVHSSPFISAFYKVEDYAESSVVRGAPATFKIRQSEGKYRSDKETLFDWEGRKITFNNHLKGTKDEYATTGPVFWDLISGFYYLRTLTLETGRSLSIDIFDSNKFYKAEVAVLGRERITVSGKGEVNTVKVKPVLKSEGLFQSKGDIVVWLTDDDNRVPVKIETKVPIGKVVAKLRSLRVKKQGPKNHE